MNRLKKILTITIFCMIICSENLLQAERVAIVAPKSESISSHTTQKAGERSQFNFAQRQAMMVKDYLGKTGIKNKYIIDTLARTQVSEASNNNPKITTQPRENLNTPINENATDHPSDIIFDTTPPTNINSTLGREISPSNMPEGPIGEFLFPGNRTSGIERVSPRDSSMSDISQPINRNNSFIDLTSSPRQSTTDTVNSSNTMDMFDLIDLTTKSPRPSQRTSQPAINTPQLDPRQAWLQNALAGTKNSGDANINLASIIPTETSKIQSNDPNPFTSNARQPLKNSETSQYTAQPVKSTPTSAAESQLMRLNSEGALVDSNGNAVTVKLGQYTRNKKGNRIPTWLKEQPIDFTTKMNDWRLNTTTSRIFDTRNDTTYETVKNNKTGMATTTWPTESDGYSRQVVKNKTGNATETLNYQSPSDRVSGITNTEITNYKVYDINNPQANGEHGNIISSVKISNNFINYKLYNNDGSGNYTSYTLYTENFFDRASNSQFSKGDIKIESSDPTQPQKQHIENNRSEQYQQWKNKARDVADQIKQQFIEHAIITPTATLVRDVSSINPDGTLAPVARSISAGPHITIDPITLYPTLVEKAKVRLLEGSAIPTFNQSGTRIGNERALQDRIVEAKPINNLNEHVQQNAFDAISRTGSENINQITNDVAIKNALKRKFKSAELTVLLFVVPGKATSEQPVSRSLVWSAITENMTDSVRSTNKLINEKITSIKKAASKTLDRILGDRATTNNVKQTRVRQLIENTNITIKKIANSAQNTVTQASDLVSNSTTTFDPKTQTKTVKKPDGSVVSYTYKNGKVSVQEIQEPGGKKIINTYEYDAQGKVAIQQKTTIRKQNINPSQIETIYFNNGQRVANSIATPNKNNPNLMDVTYNRGRLDQLHSTLPINQNLQKTLQNPPPFIDSATGRVRLNL
ncbi:MAG: hypothetical protein Q8Q60_04320 [Candidatus Chromulinivorax sp.]|nr:hypothetical protein [Candidatus Chromulinivorax sp.]